MLQIAYLLPYELEYGRWHRSKDKKGGRSPLCSAMMNKKWWLEEELNNHLLQFHQVNVGSRLSIFLYYIPGRFVSERSDIQGRRRGGASGAPENGTFLLSSASLDSRTGPLSLVLHS